MSCFLWQKYIFKEALKTFCFILLSLFFLYALIDYSLHMQDFVLDKKLQLQHLIAYYSSQFIKRQELLIPLSLLMTTLKVLFGMNMKGELIALQASGISKRAIVKPLLLFAVGCSLFNLMATEFFLPHSLNTLDKFRYEHFKHASKQAAKPVHVLTLKDRSKLVFGREDKTLQTYYDVFWIRSSQEIWHMQTLNLTAEKPVGSYVDLLRSNDKGIFQKVDSFNSYPFKFRFEIDATGRGEIPLENQSISSLIKLFAHRDSLSAYEHPQALTQLLFKLVTPLLPLLVVLSSAPFCLTYTRSHPLFATYALALFGFIALFALLDAAVILAENLTLSPYVAVLTPIALLFTLTFFQYQRRVIRL